jgi:hypothetical protein
MVNVIISVKNIFSLPFAREGVWGWVQKTENPTDGYESGGM